MIDALPWIIAGGCIVASLAVLSRQRKTLADDRAVRLKTALDAFEEGFLMLDRDDYVTYYNDEFRRQLAPFDDILDSPSVPFAKVVQDYALRGGIGRTAGVNVADYPAERLKRIGCRNGSHVSGLTRRSSP